MKIFILSLMFSLFIFSGCKEKELEITIDECDFRFSFLKENKFN